MNKDYDVIVIGSGAGGGTALEIFSQHVKKGLKVLLIEGGPFWKKEKFNQQEKDMARIYFNRGAFFSKQMTLSLAAAKTMGGSSAVYTGVSFRPPPDVLKKWRTKYGLSFLSDKYAKKVLTNIEKEIGVHVLPKSFDNQNNQLFAKGCKQLGIPVKRLRINTKGCKQQGFCNLGCTSGAKKGTLEVQLPKAIKRGVEITYNSWVSHIGPNEVTFNVNPAPSYTEANTWPEGEHTVRARRIVVAGGALNTPALLLRSKKTLGFNNDNIGRYVTLHPALNLNGIYPQKIKNYRGFPKTYYVDHFSETEGYYLETSFYYPGVTAKNHPGFGPEHFEVMQSYANMMSILVLAHDDPEAHNRISINKKGGAVLDYTVSAEAKKSLVSAVRRSAEVFFAAGCEKMLLPATNKGILTTADAGQLNSLITEEYFDMHQTPLSSAHPQGGARMGADAANSVVSPGGNLHGVPSVYVADASLFPTSTKVNPYETVMLMANYVAEQVMGDLAG